MKKLLVVGVIVLFLGIVFAPSINANVSKASIDSELVEITTEVCGINGVTPNTVLLSKEDAEEVEALFDSVRERLNATETREETEKIFNEAVVELDKYGLLGGLSVKQAQKLVTGRYQNQKVMNLFKKIFSNSKISEGTVNNLFPLIVAGCDDWYEYRPIYRITCYHEIHGLLAILLCLPSLLLTFCFPVAFLTDIALGWSGVPFEGTHRYYYPAEGWMWSLGLFGVKKFEKAFHGAIQEVPSLCPLRYMYSDCIDYIGITGFTGLTIGISQEINLIGSAFRMAIDGY